jgi:putative ABC transport system permease protein
MFALQRSLSLGYLQQRWRRTVGVILSIALGVSTMVATRTLNRNLNTAAQTAVNPLSQLTDLMVVNGYVGVPIEAADKLDRDLDPSNPGLAAIRAVQPMVLGRAVLPDLSNRSVFLIGLRTRGNNKTGNAPGSLDELAASPELKELGLSVKRLAVVDDWKIGLATIMGKVPVVVTAEMAKDLGLTPEDNPRLDEARALFRVRMSGIEKQALVVGVVHTRTSDVLPEPNVLFMDVAPASSFVFPQRPNYITQINVALEPGADKDAVRRQLQPLFAPPLKVQTIEKTYESMRDITAGLELGFSVGSVVALVIGLFLVYNALSVSVEERRRDIGILRSVGATRGQIAALFLSEACVLGLIGSLLGLPVGYGLAWIGQDWIGGILSESVLPLTPPALRLDVWTLVLALLAGMTTTILASLWPAIQAARQEPADVVRQVPPVFHLVYRLIHCGVIVLFLLAGLVCMIGREFLPLRFGAVAGIVCILLACLLATPLLAMVAGKFLQPFFRMFLGLEGRLAADNMVRSPGRTGIVIAALAATTAMVVQIAGLIRSSEHVIMDHLDESIAADVFVTSGASATEPGKLVPMDEKFAHNMRAMPEVDAVLGLRFNVLPFQNRLVLLLALDTKAFQKAKHAHSLGRNLARFPRLSEPGTALVSENFAALYKVKVGQTITVDGINGPLNLEVIGTIVDYTWNRGAILVSREWYREEFKDHQVDIFDVYLKRQDGRTADETHCRQAIARLAGKLDQPRIVASAVGLTSSPETAWLASEQAQWTIEPLQRKDAMFAVARSQLKEIIASQLRQVYGIGYAQQAVVGMVALIGVMSALFISVLQRRRQLGLLRAVGASRQQVLRSVLAEAVLMGLVGAILGLAIGIVLEWYLIDIIMLDESGFVIPMLIPWQEAGVVAGLALVLATLVGLWPAWQATRIRIAEAIAYE